METMDTGSTKAASVRIAGALALSVLLAVPVSAQNVQAVRPIVLKQPPPPAAQTQANTVQVDYKDKYEKAQQRNQQLKAENTNLRTQLAQWTSKGGSLVHAYCETPTVSRNSAGASNNCAATGYTCEPVSGLCRTVARSSDECAPYFLLDVNRCVPRPR